MAAITDLQGDLLSAHTDRFSEFNGQTLLSIRHMDNDVLLLVEALSRLEKIFRELALLVQEEVERSRFEDGK